MNEQAIKQIFMNYVTNMNDKPRHTQEAEHEVELFDEFCTSEFSENISLQNQLYEKMMNVAVEYEESGFIAGFKVAMQMFSRISERVVA